MSTKHPFQVIKHQHVTEKAVTLQQLHSSESNSSVRRCNRPKYVFVVDPSANKQEIAAAIEKIYKDQGVKVSSVNTINIKGKSRRVRGRKGKRAGFKKAIVTLSAGDSLDNV